MYQVVLWGQAVRSLKCSGNETIVERRIGERSLVCRLQAPQYGNTLKGILRGAKRSFPGTCDVLFDDILSVDYVRGTHEIVV